MMTLQEAIKQRHSVRQYIHKPLSEDVIKILQEKVDECNPKGRLHIQLVTNETRAFTTFLHFFSWICTFYHIILYLCQKDGKLPFFSRF